MNRFFVAILLLTANCGTKEELIANTRFLNITQLKITDTNLYFLDIASSEINVYSNEDILFRKEGRSVIIRYDELEDNVLGVTECTFYLDPEKTNCLIKISNGINLNETKDSLELDKKTKLFFGVVRHEIGHAFGMGHNLENDKNVMYPIFNFDHVEDPKIFSTFILDLTSFRSTGKESGIRTIFDDN